LRFDRYIIRDFPYIFINGNPIRYNTLFYPNYLDHFNIFVKLYKCPTGIRGELVTYAIMDTMNGHDGVPGVKENNLMIYRRMQIKRPNVLLPMPGSQAL